MLIAQILLILLPFLLPFLTAFESNMSLYDSLKFISPAWLLVSPIWATAISFISFWRGRTIEILERANWAVTTAKDMTPHAQTIFNFIRSKVNK
jgi:hypothetical protein